MVRLSLVASDPHPNATTYTQTPKTANKNTILGNKEVWRVPSRYFFQNDPIQKLHFMRCPYPDRCLPETYPATNEDVYVGFDNDSDNDDDNSTAFVQRQGNSSCSIGVNISHPLCAVCMRGWMRNGLSHCTQCKASNIVRKWMMLFMMMLAMAMLLYTCSRFFRKHLAKLRMLTLDILRVGTILVTFVQIGTSLPNVIQIEWPQNFLVWLDWCSVVNLDIFDLTGIGCGIRINHGHKLLFAAALPLVFATVAVISFLNARHKLSVKLKYLQKNDEKSALDEFFLIFFANLLSFPVSFSF